MCFITARAMLSAVLGFVILSVRPSVRPSVCPSHASFVTNPKNLPAIFYTTRNDNHSSFLMPKISAKFQRGHPQRAEGAKRGGVG